MGWIRRLSRLPPPLGNRIDCRDQPEKQDEDPKQMLGNIARIAKMPVLAGVASIALWYHAEVISNLNAEHESQLRAALLRAEEAQNAKPQLSLLQLYLKDVLVPADAPSLVDRSLKFFEDGRFYALNDIPGWKYQLQTTEELIQLISPDIKLNDEVSSTLEAPDMPKIHLWRAEPTIRLHTPKGLQQYFTSITVQRFDYSTLIDALAGPSVDPAECALGVVSPCASKAAAVKRRASALKSTTSLDPPFMYFLAQMTPTYSQALSEPWFKAKLQSVSKTRAMLTAKLIFVISGFDESQEPSAIRIHQDLAIISNQSELIIVTASLPSARPGVSSSHRAAIENFYKKLKVIIQN